MIGITRSIKWTVKKEYRRVRTEERMNAFKKDLLKQNWGEVYQEHDVNSAYNEFLRIVTLLYNTNCPIKQYSRKHKYMDCPWITKGLQNACIKKIALYRDFLRTRTKDAEIRYKRYKNRLTNILRYSKKEYYMKQLDINRNNNKRLWEILNSVIKRGTGQKNDPKYFICNDHEEYNMDVLNEFFVTAGPNLARTTTHPGKAQDKQ